MPNISWITTTTGALVERSGYTIHACSESPVDVLSITHSPCRGDASRRASECSASGGSVVSSATFADACDDISCDDMSCVIPPCANIRDGTAMSTELTSAVMIRMSDVRLRVDLTSCSQRELFGEEVTDPSLEIVHGMEWIPAS